MDALETKRIAAWAINFLLKEHGLGAKAEKFNGDDDNWQVDAGHSAAALVNGRMAVKVEFEGDQVTVYVPDAFNIIRGAHLSDFNPAEHNIVVKYVEDFKGDVEDDIVGTITLDDKSIIPGIDGPRRHVPKRTMSRKFTIKGSMDR